MIAVLFEVVAKPEKAHRYFELAAQLKSELDRVDGFISVERFESLTQKGRFLSLSYWRDEGAVKVWRSNLSHRRAQGEGRTSVFDSYRIRVAAVLRDYGSSDRAQSPAHFDNALI